jgi:GTP-binding protein YchF
MGFNCGIVGLPNVGKSTLFNALTAAQAQVANYPFSTIDPNVGIVPVPDPRLDRLTEIYKPAKTVPTTLEFLDIAGLVEGASRGEGLGNQFLAQIRNVDAIVHIIRCFDDPDIAHVDGSIDPRRDIETVETELMVKDLETVERRMSEAEKRAKSGDKKAKEEADFCAHAREHLGTGRLARYLPVHTEEQRGWLHDMHLLTNKPVLYVCNVHEQHLATETGYISQVRELAGRESAKVAVISAEVEAEVAELPEADRPSFLLELGLKESGLNQIIREGYDLLQLITFFSVNANEAHAWTVRKGATAVKAAGVIHTDFERGFILAEIIKYADLDRLGSEAAVREHGLLHVQGRDYVVDDGDIMFVRFNV